MQRRLGPWSRHVQHWPATDGRTINVQRDYIATGRLPANHRLRRGEIGCYDSHVRIWRHIVEHKIAKTLILEDDAELVCSARHKSAIETAMAEANRLVPGWQALYVSHRCLPNSKMCLENKVAPGSTMFWPRMCMGLPGYILTLEGARKCLQHCVPFREAADVYHYRLQHEQKLVAVACSPAVFWVAPVVSDTTHIK